MKKILLSAVVLLFAGAVVFAVIQLFRSGPVQGRVIPPAESAVIGDPISVRAEITAPPGVKVTAAELVLPSGWILSGREKIESRICWNTEKITFIAFDAVPMFPAEAAEAVLAVSLADIRGRELPVWKADIDMPSAVKADAPEGELLPLKIAGELSPPEKETSGAFLIIAAVLAAAAVLTAVFLLLKKRPQKEKDFWTRTMEELEEIRKGIAAGRELDILLIKLSDTVRNYFEERFHIPASRQTTQEFFAALERPDAPVSSEDRQALGNFLRKAELVKFACARAEKQLLEKAADDAAGLVLGSAPEKLRKEKGKDV